MGQDQIDSGGRPENVTPSASANQVLVSTTTKAIQIQISGIGLYLDDNLSRGTFSNANDISSNYDFECLTIEVIAFC